VVVPDSYETSWDKADNCGKRVATGVYFIVIDAGTASSRLKAIVR